MVWENTLPDPPLKFFFHITQNSKRKKETTVDILSRRGFKIETRCLLKLEGLEM